MNKLFQRTIKRGIMNRSLLMTRQIRQHYQVELLRHPENTQIIIFDSDFITMINTNQTIIDEIFEQEPELVREKLVIPGPPVNEFSYTNELEMSSVRRTNMILNEHKRNPPMKKPIMTPDGIRVGKLVIPGPPSNEFSYINKTEKRSVRLMEEKMAERKRNPIKEKVIMTPDGPRVGKLVMPPAPKDQM